MSRKDVQEIITEYEKAKRQYQDMYSEVESLYQDIDETKDEAFKTVESVEELINSIKKTPHAFKKDIKKMEIQEKKFADGEQMLREMRNRNLAEGFEAISALGIGVAAIATFGEFLSDIVAKISKGKIAGSAAMWIIVIALVVILLGVYLIRKSIIRRRLAKEATTKLGKTKAEIKKLEVKKVLGAKLLYEIAQITKGVYEHLNKLKKYKGFNYKEIPKQDQILLQALVNDTTALSIKINEQIS